jgi:hypothetical protein
MESSVELLRQKSSQYYLFSLNQNRIYISHGGDPGRSLDPQNSIFFCLAKNKTKLRLRLHELLDSEYIISRINNEMVAQSHRQAQNFFDAILCLTTTTSNIDLRDHAVNHPNELVAPIW